nr:nucleoside hydrolase [Spirochaeta sp.]
VFGNVAVETATTNARRLVEIAGRDEIPVCRGAARSLTRPFPGAVAHVHGADGQGDAGLAAPSGAEDPRRATEFIIETVLAHPGEVTLVALGPLTNLALALVERPEIARHARQVVCMGGNVYVSGNASPAAEANVLSDPEAADIVLSAEWPVTMCGLDVTHRITMTPADLERIFRISTPAAQHLARIVPFYRAFYEANVSGDGIYVHDSTTISFLLHPDAFETETLALQVDTSDGIGRGKLWPRRDARGQSAGARAVTICRDVDARRVVEAEIAALERGL